MLGVGSLRAGQRKEDRQYEVNRCTVEVRNWEWICTTYVCLVLFTQQSLVLEWVANSYCSSRHLRRRLLVQVGIWGDVAETRTLHDRFEFVFAWRGVVCLAGLVKPKKHIRVHRRRVCLPRVLACAPLVACTWEFNSWCGEAIYIIIVILKTHVLVCRWGVSERTSGTETDFFRQRRLMI